MKAHGEVTGKREASFIDYFLPALWIGGCIMAFFDRQGVLVACTAPLVVGVPLLFLVQFGLEQLVDAARSK